MNIKFSEIDEQLESCLNTETGEFNEIKFAELEGIRDEKIEGCIISYKNKIALVKAIKEEEKALKERRESIQRDADSMKNFIDYILEGQKFETARVKVTFKRSQSTEVSDGFIDWCETHHRDDLLRYKAPEPSLNAVKAALEAGETDIPARIVENVNMIIK